MKTVLNPPNKLRSKVRGVSGPPDPNMIKNIDNKIEDMGRSYLDWARQDLLAINKLLREIIDKNAFDQQILEEIHGIIIEMRGQGGSFGYPQITQVGRLFSIFIDALLQARHLDETALELCKNFTNTIDIILKSGKDPQTISGLHHVIQGMEKAMKVYAKRQQIDLPY